MTDRFDDYLRGGLIDADRLHALFDAFSRAMGLTASILSIEGEVLIGTRWQRICSDFHRRHRRTEELCLKNNRRIFADMADAAEPTIYRCPHGLIDAAAPIVVQGVHVATLIVGQFLLSPLDAQARATFREQAVRWGFDESAYFEALSAVPVVPEKRVQPLLQHLQLLAEMIGDMAVTRLRRKEADEARRRAHRALERENKRRLDEADKLGQILAGSPIPTFVIDADCRITHWNHACEVLTGIPAADVVGTRNHRDVFYDQHRDLLADLLVKEAATGELATLYGPKVRSARLSEEGYQGEDFFPKLGKTGKWLFFTAVPLRAADGDILGAIETIQDITERQKMIRALKDREKELEEKSRYLEKVNQALKASLDHREIEKRAVEETMLVNLKRFVFPYLAELGKCGVSTDARAYLNIVQTNLNDIVSRFSKTVFAKYIDFTPTEVRIADLIREGHNSKAIADLMGLSPSSIQWHRKNIRDKLGLTNKKVNLQTYLASLND